MKLREYQERAISDLRGAYARGHRAPCLVLPTGGGKTVIAASIIRQAVERGNRVLFLAHRQELLHQTVSKLSAAGIYDVRMIRADQDVGLRTSPVTVASVPTLTGWDDRMPLADLVVFDECHHVKAVTWASIADRYESARLLGMTATPERADGKPLGDIFDSLVVGSTVRELTELGHLVRCRVISTAERLDRTEIAQEPAEAYTRFAYGKRAVIFCRTLDHARQVAAAMPVPTAVVHGKSPRTETMQRFASGEIRAVCNVHVLTEGWDDPGVEVCILARQPGHVGTYLQMVGRVLRPAAGKVEALVIDLGGVVHDHGTPDAERRYSLDGRAIELVDRDIPRQCATCGAVFRKDEVVDGACPVCGATLSAGVRQTVTRVTGDELAEVERRPPRPMRPVFLASKYPATCRLCLSRIGVGDRIAWSKGEKPAHELCWANQTMGAA